MTTHGSPASRDVLSRAKSTLDGLLPQLHIGILAEMLDVLFDQRGQLSRLANLDPVVHRPEEAIALCLEGAARGIHELEDEHGREMDDVPQGGHEFDIF